MIKDVSVVITRETAALTQAGFGMPLILATDKDLAYKEYTDISSVATDYVDTTEAYKMANAIFAQSPRPEKIAILGVLYDSGTGSPAELTSALNTLVETNNDWYFLLCEEQGDLEITALSGWIDAQKKIYFAATSNKLLAGTLTSERTAILFSDSPTEHPDAAWIGKCAPQDPGSITWKFKTLNGITPVSIAVADLTQLHTDHGNTYITKLGISQASEGYVTSGEYIDVIRSQDFIEARMIENVSRILYTQPKVPYTNAGISQIASGVNSTLKLATSNGIIAKDDAGQGQFTVTVPRKQDIPDNDVAARKLSGIKWTAVLAGAIHAVTINGALSLSL